MFYKVEIPNIVYNDIIELTDYIYRFSFDMSISKKVYDDLYKAIFSLDFLPNRYEKYIWEYRRIIVNWSYKILYRIDEDNSKVIIIRVIRSEQEENVIYKKLKLH